MFHRFLSVADTESALRSFARLGPHDIRGWALTGGFAVEIHHILRGHPPSLRPLNDIDFIADSFDCIPATLASDYLFRHIHPLDPPGRTMLQAIDPENAVRIDVFRAYGLTMRRTGRIEFPQNSIRLISLEDLAARTARLALNLAGGAPTPAKHATDYLRLANLVDAAEVEEAWRDQRKPNHPATFEEADGLLRDLIPTSDRLLVTLDYSTQIEPICPRCSSSGELRLADPRVILSLLKYC